MVPEFVPVGRVEGCALLVRLVEIVPAAFLLETDERSEVRFQPRPAKLCQALKRQKTALFLDNEGELFPDSRQP